MPSLLAPGNLPALRELGPVRLALYTTRHDASTLMHSSVVKRVEQLATVLVFENDHDSVRDRHNAGLARAWHEGAGFVPFCADEICADGLGEAIVHAFQSSHRALMHLGYRLQPELRDYALSCLDDGVIRITPARLSGWHLQHMGCPPAEGSWAMSRGTRSLDAYGSHGFHLSCRFVYPTKPMQFERAADQDLARLALDDPSQVKLATSSAELLCSGIEDSGSSMPGLPIYTEDAVPPEDRMVEIMRTQGDAWNRRWLATTFWTENGTTNPAEKAEVEAYQAERAQHLYDRYLAVYGESALK